MIFVVESKNIQVDIIFVIVANIITSNSKNKNQTKIRMMNEDKNCLLKVKIYFAVLDCNGIFVIDIEKTTNIRLKILETPQNWTNTLSIIIKMLDLDIEDL